MPTLAGGSGRLQLLDATCQRSSVAEPAISGGRESNQAREGSRESGSGLRATTKFTEDSLRRVTDAQ